MIPTFNNNITGGFLSVKRWEPNFVLEKATLTHKAIWVRLSQLPQNSMIDTY